MWGPITKPQVGIAATDLVTSDYSGWVEPYGPVTALIEHVYHRHLHHLQRQPAAALHKRNKHRAAVTQERRELPGAVTLAQLAGMWSAHHLPLLRSASGHPHRGAHAHPRHELPCDAQ